MRLGPRHRVGAVLSTRGCRSRGRRHRIRAQARADGRDRTGDIRFTRAVLYQLSYVGLARTFYRRNVCRRDAIRVLERTALLVAKREPGRPIQLVLRRDYGSGAPYTNPGQAARAAKEAGAFDSTDLYVQLPCDFWTRGWAIVLSAPGLAMLLVMLMLTSNGTEERVWINPGQARARFGLSEDTWSRTVAELRRYGVLEIQKKPVSEDFGWRRTRNTYTLAPTRLDEPPGQPAEDGRRGTKAALRRPAVRARG
jgi:hypothetical protein